MRRFFLALLAAPALLAPLSLPAQVNEDELEQGQAPISFFNYEGPQARIETRDQIRGIGYSLGRIIFGAAGSAGARNRYFVIHVVGPAEGVKLDADIFGLGYDVGVDHIRNLRLIIQGYLEAAYAYNERDAALLAQYITIYNAVYRGDWDYVTGRYKGPVTAELNPAHAGLSIRFDEWPGQTLMLVPLGRPDSLSAIDTSAISDRQVVEELRKDDDMGIEQRQGMVDLKEREAEEAEQRAREQRQEAEEEQRLIDEERRHIEEERRRIDEERRIAGEPEQPERQEPAGRPQQEPPAAPGSSATDRAEQAGQEPPGQEDRDSRERELDAQEEALDRRQEAVEEKREDARRDEEFADQKREEAREERENIARDQQALINEEPRKETGPGIIAAIIESQDSPLGRIIRVSPETGEELGRSTVNMINTRTIYSVNGRLFAIAGENRGGGAVRLIEVDPESLETKAQGNDDIHPQSPLWVSGADLFAVTVTGGTPYLGRFNYQLTRLARSSAAVHPFASVLFGDGFLLTQRPDGSALVLNPQTLAEP
ncbi:MAG: hypothetical protein LBO76_00445 [Treponema sp.]|jgi:hypothetical protein|nr:hypothetical protein [Treponema sp.]